MTSVVGELQDVGDLVVDLGQVVHGVGVVPENPEIGGSGAHPSQPANGLLGIPDA